MDRERRKASVSSVVPAALLKRRRVNSARVEEFDMGDENMSDVDAGDEFECLWLDMLILIAAVVMNFSREVNQNITDLCNRIRDVSKLSTECVSVLIIPCSNTRQIFVQSSGDDAVRREACRALINEFLSENPGHWIVAEDCFSVQRGGEMAASYKRTIQSFDLILEKLETAHPGVRFVYQQSKPARVQQSRASALSYWAYQLGLSLPEAPQEMTAFQCRFFLCDQSGSDSGASVDLSTLDAATELSHEQLLRLVQNIPRYSPGKDAHGSFLTLGKNSKHDATGRCFTSKSMAKWKFRHICSDFQIAMYILTCTDLDKREKLEKLLALLRLGQRPFSTEEADSDGDGPDFDNPRSDDVPRGLTDWTHSLQFPILSGSGNANVETLRSGGGRVEIVRLTDVAFEVLLRTGGRGPMTSVLCNFDFIQKGFTSRCTCNESKLRACLVEGGRVSENRLCKCAQTALFVLAFFDPAVAAAHGEESQFAVDAVSRMQTRIFAHTVLIGEDDSNGGHLFHAYDKHSADPNTRGVVVLVSPPPPPPPTNRGRGRRQSASQPAPAAVTKISCLRCLTKLSCSHLSPHLQLELSDLACKDNLPYIAPSSGPQGGPSTTEDSDSGCEDEPNGDEDALEEPDDEEPRVGTSRFNDSSQDPNFEKMHWNDLERLAKADLQTPHDAKADSDGKFRHPSFVISGVEVGQQCCERHLHVTEFEFEAEYMDHTRCYTGRVGHCVLCRKDYRPDLYKYHFHFKDNSTVIHYSVTTFWTKCRLNSRASDRGFCAIVNSVRKANAFVDTARKFITEKSWGSVLRNTLQNHPSLHCVFLKNLFKCPTCPGGCRKVGCDATYFGNFLRIAKKFTDLPKSDETIDHKSPASTCGYRSLETCPTGANTFLRNPQNMKHGLRHELEAFFRDFTKNPGQQAETNECSDDATAQSADKRTLQSRAEALLASVRSLILPGGDQWVPLEAVPSLIQTLEACLKTIDAATISLSSSSSSSSTSPPGTCSSWGQYSKVMANVWRNLVSVHSVTACFTPDIATRIVSLAAPDVTPSAIQPQMLELLKSSQFKHLYLAVQVIGLSSELQKLAVSVAKTIVEIYSHAEKESPYRVPDPGSTIPEYQHNPAKYGCGFWFDPSGNGGAWRLPRTHAGFGHDTNTKTEEESTFKCKHKLHKQKKTQLLLFFCLLSGICLGWKILNGRESIIEIQNLIFMFCREAPILIVYDFACRLRTVMMSRETCFACRTIFKSDIFHSFGHVDCPLETEQTKSRVGGNRKYFNYGGGQQLDQAHSWVSRGHHVHRTPRLRNLSCDLCLEL